MLNLAVAYRQETFERIRSPLAERGIRVRHVPSEKRTFDLETPPWTPDEFDVGFVYPSRMMEGGVVDGLLSVPWVNGREAVLTSRNKGGVIARLGRAGIPVPKTVVVSNPVGERELRKVFEKFDSPVVVKPNSTTRGTGIAKVADLDSFLGVVDYLNLVHDYPATGDKSFLVQEYLPNAVDYRAMVIDGEYVGAVERRLPDEALSAGRWKHNVHRGAEARGISLPDEYRKIAERTAKTLEIPFCGVDLLALDNRVVVNETNARPTIDEETKYENRLYDRLAELVRTTRR